MRTVVVLGVGVTLLLAGCGGGDETPSAVGTTTAGAPASSASASSTGAGPSGSGAASGDAFGPSGSASAPAGPSTGGAVTGGTPGAAATTPSGAAVRTPGSKGLTTSAWSAAANEACAQYTKVLGPGGGGDEPAQVQSRLRDRAWAITGRLRGLARGSSQTESFVQLLYGVGQQSDWLIQQYLDPKADRAARTAAQAKRDAQLEAWYGQAEALGTQNCAAVMKSA